MQSATRGRIVRRAALCAAVSAAIFTASVAAPRPAAAHGGAGISFSIGFPFVGAAVYAAPPVVYAPPPVYYPAPAVVYGPPVYRHRYYHRVRHYRRCCCCYYYP